MTEQRTEEPAGTLGPIDYLVVEFPGSRFDGRVIPAVMDLIAAGIVRVLDVAFVAKDDDGAVTAGELEDVPDLGPMAGLSDFLADLVTADDLVAAAEELEPGSSAAVIVWENRWAVPFVEAVRGSGGEFVASGRLVGADVMAALAGAGAGN